MECRQYGINFIKCDQTFGFVEVDPVQHNRFLLFPWLGFSPHVANDKLSRFGLVHE